ncbi:MAG: CPBP family intramembrane glutamate endopeptidase, partial [Prochlorococcus sp.]
MSQSPMSRANPTWKVLLALLALVLAVAVWVVALVDSLNRPSVTATLSLQQQEMALLAEPAVPVQVRPLLVGTDPQQTLRKALSDIPLVQLDYRQRL